MGLERESGGHRIFHIRNPKPHAQITLIFSATKKKTQLRFRRYGMGPSGSQIAIGQIEFPDPGVNRVKINDELE